MENKKKYELVLKAYHNAYAKYSNFSVGALVITKDDNYYLGANIENINSRNEAIENNILDIKNVFREDNVEKSYDRELILKNAPEKEAGCVSVPQTVE
mgnify:CR=1 FL=1